jgi:hypothetical protein
VDSLYGIIIENNNFVKGKINFGLSEIISGKKKIFLDF